MTGSIRVGTSGWVYPHWRKGAFYPQGTPQKKELGYLAARVRSVEINASFYSLQKPANYESWSEQTPDDFVFSVKGSQFVTHMKRLLNPESTLPNYFASGLLALGPKLGPILWQLPPSFGFDVARVTAFLDALPRTTAEAAEVAERHDDRLDGRSHTTTDEDRPLRYAFEVRNRSFQCQEFTDLMREKDAAIVVAAAAGEWPHIEETTTGFTYIRLHGDDDVHSKGYPEKALADWARKIRRWRKTGDVYAYFDNDAEGHAPHDAQKLITRLRR